MPINKLQIKSTSLAESREMTVFLPSSHSPASNCPIVFCTDGQALAMFAHGFESRIRDCELPEIVLVGVHSSQHRAQEYTLGYNDLKYRTHEQFFTEEVPEWLKSEFGLVTDRSRTGVFGFSHGGAFVLTMAARHRDLYGLVIAFSIAGGFEQFQITEQSHELSPRFYLSAGTREKPLLKTTRRLAKHLNRHKIDCVVTERPAGHDYEYWRTELPIALKWGFAASNSHNICDIS